MHVELLISGHRIGGVCDQAVGKEISRSPWDGTVLGTYAEGGWSELLTAVASADDAFHTWKLSSIEERIQLFERIIALISERHQELAELISKEVAKPILMAGFEVTRMVETFRAAKEALEHGFFDSREETSLDWKLRVERKRQPRGVVFAITPFNFPMNLAAHKIAPALASGNTVVLKPSPKAALSTLTLALLLHEAGVPAGVLNTWVGPNPLVMKALRDERVKMLSFTGSAEVGWHLRQSFPRLPMTLELGGDAPVVVTPTADVESAVQALVMSGFGFGGQSCISAQHVYIHSSIYEKLASLLRQRVVEGSLVGSPESALPICSALIDQDALDKFELRVKNAISDGAVVTRAPRHENARAGLPTLLENVKPDCELIGNEAFSPLLVLHKYDDLSRLVSILSRSQNKIHASIFSHSEAEICEFRALNYPGLLVNLPPNTRLDSAPYGGAGNSGVGREGPAFAMEEMTEWQTSYYSVAQ